jgi:hypothetical protein
MKTPEEMAEEYADNPIPHRVGESLYVEVKVFAGAGIKTVARDLSFLASRLGVCVFTTFNGTRVFAHPDEYWPNILERWSQMEPDGKAILNKLKEDIENEKVD